MKYTNIPLLLSRLFILMFSWFVMCTASKDSITFFVSLFMFSITIAFDVSKHLKSQNKLILSASYFTFIFALLHTLLSLAFIIGIFIDAGNNTITMNKNSFILQNMSISVKFLAMTSFILIVSVFSEIEG